MTLIIIFSWSVSIDSSFMLLSCYWRKWKSHSSSVVCFLFTLDWRFVFFFPFSFELRNQVLVWLRAVQSASRMSSRARALISQHKIPLQFLHHKCVLELSLQIRNKLINCWSFFTCCEWGFAYAVLFSFYVIKWQKINLFSYFTEHSKICNCTSNQTKNCWLCLPFIFLSYIRNFRHSCEMQLQHTAQKMEPFLLLLPP